jgi:nucleoside-diphosphate-sugar epimerase
MQNLLVTGGTGFIAQALFSELTSSNCRIKTTVRNEKDLDRLPKGVLGFVTGNLETFTDWKPLLEDVDAVVHLAAHVHRMGKAEQKQEERYRRINLEVTRVLSSACSTFGVKRFIFLSSVKVMGEETPFGEVWNEFSPCHPHDSYGQSKYDAERVLMEIGQKTGMEVVILRLPLVYGPGIKANMARLFKIVNDGIPLPFGAVKNARSLLYVGNLVDAICRLLEHSMTGCQTYLVSDGEDCSTPELIRRIADALGCPARLFPFPPALLCLAGKLAGHTETVNRLLNSLVIDSSKIRRELHWTPPYSMEQGLAETAAWFKRQG